MYLNMDVMELCVLLYLNIVCVLAMVIKFMFLTQLWSFFYANNFEVGTMSLRFGLVFELYLLKDTTYFSSLMWCLSRWHLQSSPNLYFFFPALTMITYQFNWSSVQWEPWTFALVPGISLGCNSSYVIFLYIIFGPRHHWANKKC